MIPEISVCIFNCSITCEQKSVNNVFFIFRDGTFSISAQILASDKKPTNPNLLYFRYKSLITMLPIFFNALESDYFLYTLSADVFLP
jgi:hypothetical protein